MVFLSFLTQAWWHTFALGYTTKYCIVHGKYLVRNRCLADTTFLFVGESDVGSFGFDEVVLHVEEIHLR